MAARSACPPRARMAQVKQQAPSGPASLLDTVLEGDQERLALLAELEGPGAAA